MQGKRRIPKPEHKPLVGDNVEIAVLDEEHKKGNIEKVLPRENELIRPAVANIDLALIIFAAAKPQPNFNLLDRFLVMMEYQNVPVAICFNKTDLVTEEELHAFADIYAACGYRTLYVSAKEEKGVDALLELLKGKTAAVAGPSGVGKSSLVNRLQPNTPCRQGKSAARSSAEDIPHDILKSYRSAGILILWIHRDSPHFTFREWKKKT